MDCHIQPRIEAIPAAQWDALYPSGTPFTRHAYLLALEQSGCVGGDSGWYPCHLTIEKDGQLLAALPCYLKLHSYGEYLFDWSWARAYQQHGLEYYPKLVSAVPFTPAMGQRVGLAQGTALGDVAPLLTEALDQLNQRHDGSGVQCLFALATESDALRRLGWLQRHEVQYHWVNRGYASFEQFLARFTARQRKNVRKERQRVANQGIEIEVVEGERLTDEHWQAFYRCYRQTYLKRSGHDGYLNLAFFQRLARAMPGALVLMVARRKGLWVAAALYIKDNTTLYGRYWGALTEVDCLHFELCCYQGIQYCIERGLTRFDPGAQGEHKLKRGFEPVLMYGNCRLAHPGFAEAIDRFCNEERTELKRFCAEARTQLPFKAE